MKKKMSKSFLKAGLAVFVVALFLLTTMPVNASIPETNDVNKQKLYLVDNPNEPVNDDFWVNKPSSGLFYVVRPLITRLTNVPYIKIRDWSDKPFPIPTRMLFGNGISIRSKLPVIFVLMASPLYRMTRVEFYSDGELYGSWSLGPIYFFVYYEKGFHHLEFIPEGLESETLEMDVQIGFNGFVENILPYLT